MSNLRLATMRSWHEANTFLGKRDSKKVGHNTYARRIARLTEEDEGVEYDIAIRYHSTDIVTYHPDGSITLNTGGWDTTTTTNRMQMLTPAHVWVDRQGGTVNVTDRLSVKVWSGIHNLTLTPPVNAG